MSYPHHNYNGGGYPDDGYSSYTAGSGGGGDYDYYAGGHGQEQHQQYSHEDEFMYYQGAGEMNPFFDNYQQQEHHYVDPLQSYQHYPGPTMEGRGGWDTTGGEMTMMVHPQQQHQQQYGWHQTATPVAVSAGAAVKKGEYYLDTEFTADELLYGHAVSALAYDPTFGCMYLAGTTQNVSSTRYKVHRASLLVTYTTTTTTTTTSPNPTMPPTVFNDSVLYSSVAGHPEAHSSTIQAIYNSVYGIPKVTTVSAHIGQLAVGGRGVGRRNYPPPHAYLPPYGGGELAESATPHTMTGTAAYGGPSTMTTDFQQPGHIGITELLPLGEGYVASVSPSAVRIHTYGGLQIHDHKVEGMICGTIHPHSGPGDASHISVGGLSAAAISSFSSSLTTTTTGSSQTTTPPTQIHRKDLSAIHCLDLWQGLRVIYSHSFKDAVSGGDHVAVTSMATSHDRGSIVAGCTDGKIRVLDGSLRELATVKSHMGGVSSISVSPDGMLIATTGYSSRAKPTSAGEPSNALYAFPDPTVYIYDIRFLGRGGISHPFAGVKGAPRYVRFIPDVDGCTSNRLLVASGKQGGGIQILTPFEPQNGKSTSFLLPPLQQGESLSAFSHPEENGDELALGTSLGRVLRYCLSGSKAKQKIRTKVQLEIPPYLPALPDLSLDPTLLQGDPDMRNGTTEEVRSIFGTYTMLVSD
jgi:hypothetical protein